jgi:L-ascorbate metabolism protein UlaG (beta-lactamase superfamily)
MKNPLVLILLLILMIGAIAFVMKKPKVSEAPTTDEQMSVVEPEFMKVTPIAHATAVLSWDDTIFYTDPVGGSEVFDGQPVADIILITDTHGDHLNVDTLEALRHDRVTIIAPQAVVDELPEDLFDLTTVMANDDVIEEAGFKITAIPMYNLPESEDSFHPKGRGNGYIIEKNGHKVYVAGDTAGTNEMRALKNVDVAFVPMNLPYTMTVDEAANAVLEFAPKFVYPYHYQGQDGFADINKFKELVDAGNKGIQVVLVDWYPQQ